MEHFGVTVRSGKYGLELTREKYAFINNKSSFNKSPYLVIRDAYTDETGKYYTDEWCLEYKEKCLRFLYKGIIINHNKKPSQPTLKRRFFKKKAAFFHGPVWERSGADFILKRKGEFF